MDLTGNKETCCGCTACYSICPKHAITMKLDREGFFYPAIDENKCVNCGMCEKVCSFKGLHSDGNVPQVFAARNKNRDILMRSSSGGIFSALSDCFLKKECAVICSYYDVGSYSVKYAVMTSESDCLKACGSKYMKSNPGDVFKEAEAWLRDNKGKRALFIGMGCEADGFRSFAEAKGFRDRVTIVDIICHGGSSPLIWEEYARYLENTNKILIKHLSFKDKRIDWYNPTPIAVNNDNEEISIRQYVNIFNSACAYRPSCYVCPYASVIRKSDITIGDYWGIEKKYPHFYDPKGNSVLLIHTEQGEKIFMEIQEQLDFMSSSVENCIQQNLQHPTAMPTERERFWSTFQKYGIKPIIQKYGNISTMFRVKRKLSKIFG